MRRARNPAVWRSVLCAMAIAVGAPSARAQSCESTRPTDAEGAAGVSYGAAKADFLDSPSGRARVHYALTGPHAPPTASTMMTGVPDAVVVAAQAADDALDKYAALSYVTPLSDKDSPCASNGDSDAIDIYLIQFASADGQALLDHCEAGTPKHCAGFVLVENDFKGGGYANTAEGMRTVVPHELFHLVQDAYDADVERWWAEGTAQWAAKQVYPDLKDLERFLPAYFDNPWRPLNVPPNGVITNFLYATAIWPVFLEQRFDPSIVRQVFEGFGQGADGVLPTTDVVLQNNNSTLAREYLEFAAYDAATGSRTPDAGGYADAANYPLVPLTAVDVTQTDLASDVDAGLGAFYYSASFDTPTELELSADSSKVTALLLPMTDGKVQVADAKPLPASLMGDSIVVVAGQTLQRTDAPFTLQAGSGASEPKSSGCAVATIGGEKTAGSGALLGFVVTLLGRWKARTRGRKGR